nr:MAG TPA: hypothetical protein [Caudoviricetes sp.]
MVLTIVYPSVPLETPISLLLYVIVPVVVLDNPVLLKLLQVPEL